MWRDGAGAYADMESMRYWHDIVASGGSGVVGDDDDDGKTAAVKEAIRQLVLALYGDGDRDGDGDDVHAKEKEEARNPQTFTVRLWSADYYHNDDDDDDVNVDHGNKDEEQNGEGECTSSSTSSPARNSGGTASRFEWLGDGRGGRRGEGAASQDAYHTWKSGAHGWEAAARIRRLDDDERVFVAGEAYSERQAWMEGALVTAERVLRDGFAHYLGGNDNADGAGQWPSDVDDAYLGW